MIERNNKGLRYKLYARKSTDTEDKQVQSLDDQVSVMKNIAKLAEARLVDEPFEEAKSAKKPFVRPLFEQLLQDIEDGKVDGIVTWKLDRLSRNPTDSGRLQQLLQDGKLKHILTSDKSYYPEDNAIVFSVEAGMSNQYIRELAVNTKRGMASKAEKGGKNGVPPIGYLNNVIDKTIITDPDRFELVRILWDKMLTGTYSIAQLTRLADEELNLTIHKRGKTGGKPMAYSSVCAMFKNPFYYGMIRFNGQLYQGTHTPMITEAEFEKVQQIIDPSHTTRPKDPDTNFMLRNLFKCGECGFAITAERKYKTIKRNGERKSYIYYHCTGKNKQVKCTQPHSHVEETELVKQIKEKLSKFTIHPDFYRLAIETLAQEEDEFVAKDEAKVASHAKAIEKAEQSIKNLRRMRYEGEADDDSWYYAEMKTLEDKLETLQSKRNESEYKARNWREVADEVFTFARYAQEEFESDDLEKQRTVVAKLGLNLTIKDRTIEFTPNKYFLPIEKMNEQMNQLENMVRTDNNDAQKSKNTPVGVLALPDESTSNNDLTTSWLPIQVTHHPTGVKRDK